MKRSKSQNMAGRNSNRLIPIAIIVALVILSSGTLVHLLTEAWWFEAVNFSSVFWTLLTWRVLIWIVTFAVFALFGWGNYYLATRLSPLDTQQLVRRYRSHVNNVPPFLAGNTLERYATAVPNTIALIVILVIAFTAATASIEAWDTILKFLNASEFGTADPIFERDIGFYIFQLPFYESIRDWLIALLISGIFVSVPIYVLKGSINPERHWQHWISGKAKIHLSILLAAIAILVAFGFWLERYDLLYSDEGIVFGAGYSDVNARLLSLWVTSILTLALAALFILCLWQSSITLPAYGLGFYVLALILLQGAYPSFVQQFVVEPNELAKEQPYIAYNIELTRQAYGLSDVQRQEFPAEEQLTRQDLQDNQATIRNIRLWDYRPLLSTYRQLQEIRLYYKFSGVDIDRYTLDGNYRQVMLSPRELSYAQVPQQARTWVNQRLKYTHGYGMVMSPVNKVTPQGLPEFFIKDIPPVSSVDVQVTRPGIYYGEETNTYIFTGTSTDEFDYPRGDENAFTRYDGTGGVPMGSLWRRLAYAYDLGNLKILISNYFTDSSRIHYYRPIRERVAHIAPFLRLDSDPYMVVIDGKLKWIIDAYTTSDHYPYSEPVSTINNATAILGANRDRQILSGDFNYVRNSVKVLIDAYDGTMQFFVVDTNDPILATYRKIFPNLFESSQNIPPQFNAHWRYPLDLFQIQAQRYLAYHMSDPQVFYNQEDLWRFPSEIYEGTQQLVEPYYVIMRLPEEENEEFILILPFTPLNKDNMVAWMAARSDGEHYGKLFLYEFPKQELVYGPMQIEARIDQEPSISQQLTLWSQKGSNVIRGDLLVIPIEQSLLYVEPIYLKAERGELPELTRVIVAYDEEIVMEESLDTALAAIFGGVQQPQTTTPTPSTGVPSNLAQSALDIYRKAQQASQEGNWAEYGQYLQELEGILEQLNQEAKPAPDLTKQGQ